MGVGGATITDVFFFKFLKDYRISHFEAGVMRILTQIIWASIVLLVFSGLALYLPRMDYFNESTKFLAKMAVFAVIVFNGIFLHFYISPYLVRISFHKKHKHQIGEVRHFRRIAFASGAVSLVSWYFALVMGALRSVSLSVGALLSLYILLVLGAVLGSQLLEWYFSRSAKKLMT